MEAMIISGKWGKMLQFLVKTPREIDYSIADAFENDYFLFLWHFLAKLVAGVAANRWNVGHVCAVYDHSRLIALNVSGFRLYIYIYLSSYMQVSLYTCLESYLKSKSLVVFL